ncbi:apolipoprotein N-acyltransferase [Ferrimonas lipolytica]|uniref:Apolipoprotein N-acyltransferase n=1 Tax=Ferrimonas lipolytica TaxID=2724191 RepID=A0A6H1UBD7_9GAMM|nr:apolipoprotein N-acyltransferase [Ferrimonas lipolytica]QIZ75959.1 apolipoprotein N-acyltransferase [Ferrimonas lipolytica]
MTQYQTKSAGLSSAVFYLLAFIAGALSHLAFAPYDYWLLLPLSLSALLLLSQQKSAKQGLLTGLAWGFGQFIFGLRWVHVSIAEFGGMPLVASLTLIALLALYLALYPALVIYALNRWCNGNHISRLCAFPALWLVGEYLRGAVMTGFPWLWSGYSQLNGPMASLIPLVGALGVGLLLSVAAVALSSLIQGHWRYAIPLLVIAALPFGFSKSQWIEPTGESRDVALVQGNIAQNMKWQQDQLWPTMLKYQQLSIPHFDADLIVWPEAAVPAPEAMVSDFLVQFEDGVTAAGSELITGIISMDDQRNFYNSLLVLNQPQRQQHFSPADDNRYHKHQLLPIGEFVPFQELLRPLAPFFNLPMSSFARGDLVQTNLHVADTNIAPAICYEIAFPELVRGAVNPATDMLLTVSNDAWFGQSIGPLQHMAIAQMRALELGKPLLRVTNNGVTAIVTPTGEIQSQLPQFVSGVLRDKVALYQGQTPFAQYGQAPLYWLAAVMLGWGLLISRLHRPRMRWRSSNA